VTCKYEEGEVEDWKKRKFFVIEWPWPRQWTHRIKRVNKDKMYVEKGFLVYNFVFNGESMPEDKVYGDDFEKLVRDLNKPVKWWRPTWTKKYLETHVSYPTGCEGGLLRPPAPRKPLLFVIGSTDCVRSKRTNYYIHIRRAKSFRHFLKALDKRAKELGFDSDLLRRTKGESVEKGSYHWAKPFFSNDSQLNRAKNRSVLIWYGRGGGHWWTPKQQQKAASDKLKDFMKNAHTQISSGGALLPHQSKLEKRHQATWRKIVGDLCLLLHKHKNPQDMYYNSFAFAYYCHGEHDWGHRGTWDVHPAETRNLEITDTLTKKKDFYHNQGLQHLKKKIVDAIVCARHLDDLIRQIEDWAYEIYFGIKVYELSAAGKSTDQGGKLYNSSLTRLGEWFVSEYADPKSVYSVFYQFKDKRPWF
jgi:hypothetical protein